jgi:CHASE1-domain containing sensor protein
MPLSPRRAWILSITAGVGVSLTAIATLFVYRWEVSQQRSRFQQQIENLAIALQRSLNRYNDLLTFLNDHYDVRQGQVTRQEFDAFVARSLAEYPGIQALEWAPLVPASARATYEQTVQAEGYPTFRITELGPDDQLIPAGERPNYLPVTFLAPFTGNEAAFGFDLNSSPARVAAIEPARDSGEIHATGRIRLVQEQRDQYGFLMVLPRYRADRDPPSLALRQAQFAGILLGVFRVSDVVEEALQDLSYDINFDLRDQNAETPEQFLGRYDAETQTVVAVDNNAIAAEALRTKTLCPSSDSCTRTLAIGQRQWLVSFAPAVAYPLSQPYATWATLLTGLLLTGSLVLFLRNLQSELVRTQQLNELKLRFFSMASHELRTPLSTILLSTESLQANFSSLSDGQKQSNLERIHLTAQQMSQQITDLLTLTRAEVGKLEFNPAILEVTAFCQQVIDEMQPGMAQTIEFRCTGVKRGRGAQVNVRCQVPGARCRCQVPGARSGASVPGSTRYPTPDTRYPIPEYPIPDTRHPIPDTRHPIPDTRHPIPDTRHPIPFIPAYPESPYSNERRHAPGSNARRKDAANQVRGCFPKFQAQRTPPCPGPETQSESACCVGSDLPRAEF